MSRTYRHVPKWASKIELGKWFDEDRGTWNVRASRVETREEYVKIMYAYYRADRRGVNWNGLCDDKDVNGKTLGWGDYSRVGAKRYTSKRVRNKTKKLIRNVLRELNEEEILYYQEDAFSVLL